MREDNDHRHHHRLARAYVPSQVYTQRYDPAEGLNLGTIFPELYRPYRRRRV
ncbi:spore coat associated protein CotJA [Halonatronum saccharophilum]|uniref:spore coat associated protein CotJA n=1 Tax=Halonatronum saccharophilum TaxID=150060 RepID=UPI0004AEDFD5|nr:spore coat associated protein CotJA [Halonatronum saccharophilum]